MKKIYLIALLAITSIQKLKAQVNYTTQPGSPCTPFFNGGEDFADVDGDGDIDFIISGNSASGAVTELYLNDGNGVFSLVAGTPFTGLRYSSVEFGDVDGDNDQDVIISGAFGTTYYCQLFINDGFGNFSLSTLNSFQPNWLGDIQFLDVDNDNDLDVFIAGAGSGANKYFKLYLNDGNGLFTEDLNNTFIGISDVSMDVADVDGDNDQDLLICGSDRDTRLYLNNGSGMFSLVSGTGLEDVEFGSLAFADFDGDNDQDIIITGKGVSLAMHAKLYVNDGLGVFTLKTSFTGVRYSSVSVADADNDGDMDILIAGTDGNSLNDISTYLYLNDGGANFTWLLPTPFVEVGQAAYCSVKFFDADNDLDQDVFVAGAKNSVANAKLYLLDCYNTYSNVTDSICVGGEYLFPDGSILEVVADTTFLFDTLNSVLGCDSFLVKNLYVKPFINPGLISDSICFGSSYTFIDGNTITILNDTVYQSYIPGSLGCDSLVNTSVFVYPESFNAVLTANATLTQTCDTTSLFATGNVLNYNWSNGVVDNNNFIPPSGQTKYYLTGTTQNGCLVKDSITITKAGESYAFVRVNGNPPDPNATHFCSTSSSIQVTLQANHDGAGGWNNIIWYNGVQEGVPFDVPQGDSYFYFSTSHSFGCIDTGAVTISLNPPSNIQATASPSNIVCTGNQVTLLGQGSTAPPYDPFGQPQYSWSGPGGIMDFYDNNVPFIPNAEGYYKVTSTDSNYCFGSDSIYISIVDPEVGQIDPFFKNPMCLKDNTTLLPSAFPSGGNFYGPGVSNANGSFNPDWAGIGTHSIIYEYTDANGCESQVTEDIEVIESPDFNYSTSDLSVTLTANNLCSNYYWDFGDGNTNSLTTNPAYTYANPGTYSVCLVCNDISNCVNCINLSFPSFASGIVNGTIGIEEVIESENFSIFPNPNNGRFTLIYDDNIGGADVMLYSISGQLLDSYKLNKSQNSLQVDISNYENGIYFIHLKTSNDVVVKKIAKN